MTDNSLFIERTWPYAAAFVCTVAWFYGADARFPDTPDNLLAATGNSVAVIVGFLAAAKAIILSISNTKVFEKLTDAGYNNLIFNYFYEAIFCGMTFLIISILGFFFGNKDIAIWYKVGWVSTAFLALFCFVRVVRILFKLLRHV